MFNVILVDDEPNVRMGVRMMIPWEELDMQIIAEGENGEDGLEKIIEYKPDIVIADVKMPVMSGIEMLEKANKLGFKGKSLILSGYSDFSYAKEAMALGVKQFILKPLDEDELIENLKNIKKELMDAKERSINIQKGREFIVTETIKKLLLADSSDLKNVDLTPFKFYELFTVSIITLIDDIPTEENTASLILIQNEISYFKDIDIFTIDINGTVAVIFKDWNIIDIKVTLNNLYKKFGESVYITLGPQVQSVRKICESYSVASELVKNKFLFLKQGVVTEDFLNQGEECENSDISTTEFATEIFTYLEVNDLNKLEESILKLGAFLAGNYLQQEQIKVISITILRDILTLVAKNTTDKKIDEYKDRNIVAEISELESLTDITKYFCEYLTDISNTIFGTTTKSTIERIVQYINTNYNKELKLEFLAGLFGYNSAYLGKVFHQYTGENFNAYLDHLRINEAKKMLEGNELKVYEVAEKVGYTNINYFHNKFKKYVGISPLTYKKNNS